MPREEEGQTGRQTVQGRLPRQVEREVPKASLPGGTSPGAMGIGEQAEMGMEEFLSSVGMEESGEPLYDGWILRLLG